MEIFISSLDNIISSIAYISSELVLGGLLLFLLLLSIISDNQKYRWFFVAVTLLSLVLSMLYVLDQRAVVGQNLFMGMVNLSQYALFFKALVLLSGLFTTLLFAKEKKKFEAEPLVFMVAIMLGINILISSSDLLLTYVSIELVSLTSYALVYRNTAKSAEAAMKYLLFGAVSSAVMLYGMSLIYGVAHSFDYESLSYAFESVSPANYHILILAIITIMLGFLFKMGAFPMHLWIPDVYEAASTPVVAFYSTAPKIGGALALVNMCDKLGWVGMDVLSLFAVITILIGNLPALWQTNLKRLMAYSSIANAGIVIMALIAFDSNHFESLKMFLFIYVIINFSAFLLIQVLEEKGEATFESIKGLGKKNTLVGVSAVVLAISLAGIPPTGGFMAKFLVFSGFWNMATVLNQPVLWWVLAIALLNTVVALFYYIKIPYYMCFKEVEKNSEFNVSDGHKIFLVLSMILLVGSFIKIDWLLQLISIFN